MMVITFKINEQVANAMSSLTTTDTSNPNFTVVEFEDSDIGTAFAELLKLLLVDVTVIDN